VFPRCPTASGGGTAGEGGGGISACHPDKSGCWLNRGLSSAFFGYISYYATTLFMMYSRESRALNENNESGVQIYTQFGKPRLFRATQQANAIRYRIIS
jgi:hypothetical protein